MEFVVVGVEEVVADLAVGLGVVVVVTVVVGGAVTVVGRL